MGKHYERNADSTLTKKGRATRDAERTAKTVAAQTSVDVQNAPAESDPNQYQTSHQTSSHQANDAGRDAVGKRNRPELTSHNRESAALTGTGAAAINKALDDASVGAND